MVVSCGNSKRYLEEPQVYYYVVGYGLVGLNPLARTYSLNDFWVRGEKKRQTSDDG